MAFSCFLILKLATLDFMSAQFESQVDDMCSCLIEYFTCSSGGYHGYSQFTKNVGSHLGVGRSKRTDHR